MKFDIDTLPPRSICIICWCEFWFLKQNFSLTKSGKNCLASQWFRSNFVSRLSIIKFSYSVYCVFSMSLHFTGICSIYYILNHTLD